MEVRTNTYTGYFKHLAITHKDLRHDPQSETGNAPAGSKKFTRWGADEVITGLRSSIGYPAMLLELYEINTHAETPYDVKGYYSGAFTIIDRAEPDNTAAEEDCHAIAEKIYLDILQQIYQDHYGRNKNRCLTPFAEFSFNNLQITPVGPIFDNCFGWRVEFAFKPTALLSITTPPAPGTFVNPEQSS